MKIKKTLKNSIIYFIPFILLLYIVFCINIILKDLSYNYKAYNTSITNINWVKYNIEIKLKKVSNFFQKTFINTQGLERVYIHIPEKTKNKLLSNVPNSTKKYYSGGLYINKNFEDIELRYFTDNPVGWMFDQKAIRIKTKKNNIINRKRYFEYKPAQNNLLREYTPFLISKNMNLLAAEKKLVELYINGKNNGIYIESERLNEGFLRRKKIMPISLYKGEQSNNSENKIGLEHQLFNNPGLWKKISLLNFLSSADRSDLSYFFNNIIQSENSIDEMTKLLDNGNIESFSNQEIFQIFNQHMIGNDTHNMRIALDNWTGKIYQIPHDIIFIDQNENNSPLKLDWANNHLFRVINQNSYYIDKKYHKLYEYLVKNKIIDKTIIDLHKMKNSFLISKKTDIGHIQRKYFSNLSNSTEDKVYFENFIEILKKRKKDLLNLINSQPDGNWNNTEKGFAIEVKSHLPISNLLIKYKDKTPNKIVLDNNNNLIEDDKDLYFYPNEKGQFNINVSLYANRDAILLSNINIPLIDISTSKTKFTFFVDNKTLIDQINFENKFTKKKYILKKKEIKGALPKLHNIIVKNINEERKINFNKDVYIDDDLIVREEAIIQPGTTFYLSNNSSIIFKNKVRSIGEKDNPIVFKFWKKNSIDSDNRYWGSLAIHGKKTNGSIFKNVIIENGSGDTINNINYFSNISIHDTSNIKFENIFIKNNNKFDDMVHIIYSNNIYFKNSIFLNSYRDAIDVDISNNINFENIQIKNSGNDGLDLMESKALIKDSSINYSSDKGISVGENSEIKILNSKFSYNEVGIASKDSSEAEIINSYFSNNKTHLNVYKKNWRYGESGKIFAKNSEFKKSNNNFLSDKTGIIIIENSNYSKKINSSENVIIRK